MSKGILIGGSDAGQVFLNPHYANRHGLVAGATGSGKSVALNVMVDNLPPQVISTTDLAGDEGQLRHIRY